MPRININEYDFTVFKTTTIPENTIALPINASDGPSDKWITVTSYDEFVQIFGGNPSPNSVFGNSWEYAANLLLREIPVCVRRITHVIDSCGNNTDKLLEGVSTAKGIIKVKDTVGLSKNYTGTVQASNMIIEDSGAYTILKESDKGTEIDNPNYIGSFDQMQKSIYDLQTDPLNTSTTYVNAFLDMANDGTEYPFEATNHEWYYAGEYKNEKYKTFNGRDVALNRLFEVNPTGNIGDFYIDGKDKCRIDYHKGYYNPNWINTTLNYPSEIMNIIEEYAVKLNEKSQSWLSHDPQMYVAEFVSEFKDKFIDVCFDIENTKQINKVWIFKDGREPDYTVYAFIPKIERVKNNLFIEGNSSMEINGQIVSVFSSESALKKKTNVALNSFAAIKNFASIYQFNGSIWQEIGEPIEKLTETYSYNILDNTFSGSKYATHYEVPMVPTEYDSDTGYNYPYNPDEIYGNLMPYRHVFNWVKTTDTKALKTLYWKNSGKPHGTTPHKMIEGAYTNINNIVINGISTVGSTDFNVSINGFDNDIVVSSDISDNKLTSGAVSIKNTCSDPIRIYGFKVVQKSLLGESKVLYNIGLHAINNYSGRILSDSQLVFKNSYGDIISNPLPKLDSIDVVDKWYIELLPGYTMSYNKNLAGVSVELNIAGFKDFSLDASIFKYNDSDYTLSFNTSSVMIGTKHAVTVIDDNADPNNPSIVDNNGNINLLTMEYLYPGTNGNDFNVNIKSIPNQGIFIYVYKKSQFLERIELASFRFRTDDGKIVILNPVENLEDIWKLMLIKFNIKLPYDETVNKTSIYGKYLKIDINPNITNFDTYDYIQSLLSQTGAQYSYLANGSNPSDEHILHEIASSFAPLSDKYRYDIYFLSSATYIVPLAKDAFRNDYSTSVSSIDDAMVKVAESRKDCVAFLDVPYDTRIENASSFYEYLSSSYAAAYFPWGYIALDTGGTKWMPPSFTHLYTYAKSLMNGVKAYLPPAGVRRASVPELIRTNVELTSNLAYEWQNSDAYQFVNPILWINGYDYVIYGQKTLYNKLNEADNVESTLQNLNVRLVANYIKKLIFKICIELTFELNNLLTWNEFKSKLEPTLSAMAGEGVLQDYEILMGMETMSAVDLNSGHVNGTVRVAITSAVVDWDINFEIHPHSVTFNEVDYNSLYQ